MKSFISIFFIACSCNCLAQGKGYPVPPVEDGQLFYLQHTRNKNTVVYEVNLKDDRINPERPVHVYWIRYSEKGQREELSYIQRKYAYGINATMLRDSTFELSFVSNKKYKIYLSKSVHGHFQVFTTINKRKAIMTHIFVNIIGGTALSPKIDYIEISGFDELTGSAVSERVKI